MIPYPLNPLGRADRNPDPIPDPVVDVQVAATDGATYTIYEVTESRWYRLISRSAAGSNGDSAGGAGARVEIDLYLRAGWKCLCWSASAASCGAPANIKAGNGGVQDGNWPTSGDLGGGGFQGYYGRSGGGGGGAAGNGGAGNYRAGSGGGGSGIIIYQGDDYTDQNNWLYLLLTSGGGGGCGNENSSRSGGASGGAGTRGGNQSQSGGPGGTGKFTGVTDETGTITATNGVNTAGSYSAGRPGVGNVFDVRNEPKWIGGYTNDYSSTAGATRISSLKSASE